jgi:hypothetical protein
MTLFKVAVLIVIFNFIVPKQTNAQTEIPEQPPGSLNIELMISVERDWVRIQVLNNDSISLMGLELRPVQLRNIGTPMQDFDVLIENLAQPSHCYIYRRIEHIDVNLVGCSQNYYVTSSFWRDRNSDPRTIEIFWHGERITTCGIGANCTINLERPQYEIEDGYVFVAAGIYDVIVNGQREQILVGDFAISIEPVNIENYNSFATEHRLQLLSEGLQIYSIVEQIWAMPTYHNAETYCSQLWDNRIGHIASLNELFVAYSIGVLDDIDLNGWFYEEWSRSSTNEEDVFTFIVDENGIDKELRSTNAITGIITFRCSYFLP